ncbi:hypothetical protein HOY82DRAFT_616507 [Tuber indicum]|nr:hypothetical protein HOY82DRAFT_616507 [Tuber indicum]
MEIRAEVSQASWKPTRAPPRLKYLFLTTAVVYQASSSRPSVSFLDIEKPAAERQRRVNAFVVEEEPTDIDDDDIPPRRRQWDERRPAELLPQPLPRRVRSWLRYSTEDTPTSALNGPSQGIASQKQAGQLHSGHLRHQSLHFSPYIPDIGEEEQTVPSNSGRSIATLHLPASDIEIPVAISIKSNTLHGEQRIVFENAANMVRYHTWFINPLVKPAENDTLLESYWLKSRQSSARSHLVSETKNTIEDLYDFSHKTPTEIKAPVAYLLENDRFSCYPSKQTVSEPCMYHVLKAWSSGSFVQPSDFEAVTARNIYLRQRATWQGLPSHVRVKLVDDTKRRIKKMLKESGFTQNQESRAPLKDKEAPGYMDLEVSGDEESEVEDDNSDPKAGDTVEALEEGYDQAD